MLLILDRKTTRHDAVKKPALTNSEKSSSNEIGKSGKIDTSVTKEKENKEDSQKKDAPAEEQFQLNDLMSSILEEELQSIMIQVWQTLPADPASEVERFVTEKWYYGISDDLKNVLGLNVTKRLLNVYNLLIVKLKFSCRPESGYLTKFINTYNIKTFKRITTQVNSFAARFSSIADFDKIIAANNIRCGSAKVIVTPCYKFTKCPPKLNTIYNSYEEEDIKTEHQYGDGEDKDTLKFEVSSKKNVGDKETNTVQNVKTENKVKPSTDPKPYATQKTSNIKTVTTPEKNEKARTKPHIEKQTITDSKEIRKTIGNKSQPVTVSSTTPKMKDIKKSVPQNDKKTQETKKLVTEKNILKIDKPKAITAKKVLLKKKEIIDDIDLLEGGIMEESIQEFENGEEMDDEEILALICEGAIDECSSSDVE